MKKVLSAIIVTALALSLLAGCGTQTQEAAPAETKAAETAAPETAAPAETAAPETTAPETAAAAEAAEEVPAALTPGTYVFSYEDEIEGEKVECKEYIVLTEDGKGSFTAQDTVDITWNGNEIICANGSKITAKPDGENLIVTEEGQPEKIFIRTEEKIPNNEETGFKMGYYVNDYEEEIEGSKAARKDYLILLDDGKGFYSAQDIVDITWNRDQIAYADGTVIDARREGEDIIVTDNGQERVFKSTIEDLPEDLYKKIDENLNARNYEGTFVSAEGAPHKITMTITKGTEEPYAVSFVVDDNEELKGTGGNVDGGAEMGLKDSKGNAIYGMMFPVIDKYTFRVTQSDVSFIEPETDFTDLVRQ